MSQLKKSLLNLTKRCQISLLRRVYNQNTQRFTLRLCSLAIMFGMSVRNTSWLLINPSKTWITFGWNSLHTDSSSGRVHTGSSWWYENNIANTKVSNTWNARRPQRKLWIHYLRGWKFLLKIGGVMSVRRKGTGWEPNNVILLIYYFKGSANARVPLRLRLSLL